MPIDRLIDAIRMGLEREGEAIPLELREKTFAIIDDMWKSDVLRLRLAKLLMSILPSETVKELEARVEDGSANREDCQQLERHYKTLSEINMLMSNYLMAEVKRREDKGQD